MLKNPLRILFISINFGSCFASVLSNYKNKKKSLMMLIVHINFSIAYSKILAYRNL